MEFFPSNPPPIRMKTNKPYRRSIIEPTAHRCEPHHSAATVRAGTRSWRAASPGTWTTWCKCNPFLSSRSSSPTASGCPGSILFAMEMSASEVQANEASKDANVKKISQSGLKIRIRLPPRKRLSDGTQIRSQGVAEDSENLIVKNLREKTDNNTRSTTCTTAEVMAEKACSNPPGVIEDIKSLPVLPAMEVPKQADNNTRSTSSMGSQMMIEKINSNNLGEGLYKETNSNNESDTLLRDTPTVKVEFIAPGKNPVTATEVQTEEESIYNVGMRLCEEGNKKILGKELSPENSCSTPVKELCTGCTVKSPSKNLAITGMYGEVEKYYSGMDPCEDASDKVLGNGLLCETRINNPSNGLSEEANLATSGLKCEEADDNAIGARLYEARNYMDYEKLSAEAQNNVPSKRPAVSTNDKISKKRLRTSVEHATDTCKNTSPMKPFPSVGQAVEQSGSTTNLEAIKIYKEFEEKVRRTVYLDNLSHLATETIIKMALDQFGTVKNVNFLTNYTVPFDIPQSVLIEMETEKDAESVVSTLQEFPFMISGMPRPVRGKRATAVMFNDRPSRPGGKLDFHWVRPANPDYQNVRKFKFMSKRHEVENLALIRLDLEGEKMLAAQQQDVLNCNYRKLETVDTVVMTGWVDRLSRIYNMRFNEAF